VHEIAAEMNDESHEERDTKDDQNKSRYSEHQKNFVVHRAVTPVKKRRMSHEICKIDSKNI
jgi:hypothetical protein